MIAKRPVRHPLRAVLHLPLPTMFPSEKTPDFRAEPAAVPSKSARKRAMHDLQHVGETLMALDPARLMTLDLPERLRDAIVLARTITKHEGRRRQLQYIGRLMREIDSEPLKATLAQWARGPAAERARFADVERWRERVLAETDALADFVNAYPAADRASLARLVADAHAERARGAPARRFRELFRELKLIVDAAASAER